MAGWLPGNKGLLKPTALAVLLLARRQQAKSEAIDPALATALSGLDHLATAFRLPAEVRETHDYSKKAIAGQTLAPQRLRIGRD